jgi:uncharacterized membrane protein YesL
MKKTLKLFLQLIIPSLLVITFIYYLVDIRHFHLRPRYRYTLSFASFFICATYVVFTALWISRYIYVFFNVDSINQVSRPMLRPIPDATFAKN